MYSQYKNLSSQKFSQSRALKFVEEADEDELCKMILDRIKSTEVIKMLDDILQGFTEQEKSQAKRMKLVKLIFDALKNASVSIKHVDNIVSRIVIDFPSFNRVHLVKLVDYFLDRIRNNDDDFMSWKDVLPLLLERLEGEKSINFRGSDVSGQEYKISIMHSICDIDWDTKILTSVTKMFVEMIIDIKDKALSERIMRALTSKLMMVELNELPPLVHQLLKLSADHNSTLLFSTLSKYFSKNYSSIEDNSSQETSESIISSKVCPKELQETESTVLYYIYQSALDNTKGSMDYIRCLKSVVNAPEFILDNFVMSVLLLLSGLYEDQALQILKTALLRQIQEEEHQSNSAWLRHVLFNNACALDIINKVIENSNKDRQLVLKGMIDFAFVLLSIDRKVGVENHPPWDYGCRILQKIARKRHDVGGHILEILVDKIVRNGSNVIQYTDCLAYMCRRLAMTVLEHQVWITTIMEQLLVIPGNAATHVLRAILPLMRISGSIRDNLIMILRKALYRRGTHTRQMAVLGFLQLLKNLKLASLTALSQSESLSSSNVASSSSLFTQATLERPSQRANPWHNTSLCREILAILGKCFTHELEVRSHLYQELYYGILKNPELTEYVVEMLLEHLSKYYEKDENVVPPLIFDMCCALQGIEIVLQEPLADLIFSLQKIYLKVACKESTRIDQLAVVLESLCKRMAQMDLEHLGLDDDTDLNDNIPKAQQKLMDIKVALTVYESLIAYRIASWSQESVNIGQSIIALYKGYSRLADYLKKFNKPKKGKGKKDKDKDKDVNDTTIKKAGRPTAIKLPSTIMDLDTMSKSIILLYNPSNSYASEDQTNGLRGRFEFHTYILQTCLQLFQNVKAMKDHDLQNYLELNKKNFITIGDTLYKFVVSDIKTIISFCEHIVGPALECFKECCDIMCSLYPSELPAYLEVLTGIDTTKGLTKQCLGLIDSLRDIFMSSLNEEETEEITAQKIPLHLIETISKLIQKISFAELGDDDKSFDWLSNLAETQENIDIQVAIIIVQLILLVDDKSTDYAEIIQDFGAEFCAILGKIDKTEVTWQRKFQMINETNLYVTYVAVNKILATKLQNINWVLGRLNAELVATCSLEAELLDKKSMKEKEIKLCRQFSFIISTFEIISNAKITPGPASDAIFKNLQKVYNTASALTKYFKKKSTSNCPAFQSVKFIPVVQGAGSALKQAITDLILHIESSQSGGKSNDTNVQRNKILKEVMVIPGVVQAMDMFDKEIALLAKKTNVDLMKYTKYDSIRDFRIKCSQLRENIEQMNVSLMVTQTRNENPAEETSDQIEEADVSEMSKASSSGSDGEETPAKKKRT